MKERADEIQKLHPKLRMIANGSATVNALRAELSSVVVSTVAIDQLAPPRAVEKELSKPAMLRAPGNEKAFRTRLLRPKPKKLTSKSVARQAFVNVFVEVQPDRRTSARQDGLERVESLSEQLRADMKKAKPAAEIDACVLPRRNMIAATVPVAMLTKLKDDPRVAFVQPAEGLTFRLPRADTRTEPPAAPTPRRIGSSRLHGDGEGVIIGIIDVGGFDFAHPDFLDANGRTRFLSIWDQGGDLHAPPKRFGYGSEITSDPMDAAIAASKKKGGLPATMLEQQSQQGDGSHGTHVASIAAGNSGVCPKARIAAVLINVPQQGDRLLERRATFSDSSRIVHAVEYLLAVAEQQSKIKGKKVPISINISLGTNGGSHDGASGVSRWLDALLATEARSICVAAGNAGQEGPTNPTDIGWITGRIHASGRVASRGLDVDLEWTVVGDSVVDISENELEIWYGAQDRMTVQVKPPGSPKWITVRPREFIENRRLANGTILSVYNELYHPTNGSNYIAIYLSPNLDPRSPRGVAAGIWTIRLTGEEIRDGRFHCWIERDDPFELDRVGQVRVLRFPSFFTERSNVDSHQINSLACGFRVIGVANIDTRAQKINITSSQGPTRDDRLKPDIAAPGTDIVAARGFGPPDDPWIAMTGTSMASPYVCGVVGLMLATNQKLTCAQCQGILQRTCRPLPGHSYNWRDDAGFGTIDPEEAIKEAKAFDRRVNKT
jgi:subtilisin family serine protease